MKYKLIGSNDYSVDIWQTIAENRGLESISDILDISDADVLSPFLLKNMTIAIEKLIDCMTKGQFIHIIVDSDIDGYTSSAILYRYLTKGYDINKVTWSIHSGKQHGIILSELEEYNFDVLIVPDAGSSDFEQHKILDDSGITVIVLDHHTTVEQETTAIIVNPQLDDYPNKAISGAGVTYKFCQAIDMKSKCNYAEGLADYVALGLVGDMMDTRPKETRFLIKNGIKESKSNLIKSFLDIFEKVDTLSISAISYYLAPLINAVTRVGTDIEKRKMFSAFIKDESEYLQTKNSIVKKKIPISTIILRELVQVKERQDDIRDKLIEDFISSIKEQSENAITYYILDNYEHRNFSGLIAGQLANDFKKPCFILATNKDGSLGGSGRNYEKFPIEELKSYCQKSTAMNNIGGHESAFGIGFNNKDKAMEFFNFMNESLSEYAGKIEHIVDFDMNRKRLSPAIICKISELKDDYGHGFSEPLILIKDIKLNIKDITVNQAYTMLKFNINDKVIGIMFKNVERTFKEMSRIKDFKITIIGTANLNTYKGTTNYQIFIDDLELMCYNKEKDDFWF